MESFNNLMGWENSYSAPVSALPAAEAAAWDGAPHIENEMVLAMAYVRRQPWGTQYAEDKALSRGTIFPALDLPFMGEGGNSAR